MNWTEVKIYTEGTNVEILTAITLEVDINGIEIDDPQEAKRFLEANVNQGNYADYVEDALLNPTTDEVVFKFYLAEADLGKLDRVKQEIKTMGLTGIHRIEAEPMASWDWENAWKAHYTAVELGEKVVINPHWEIYEGNRPVVFNIEPGHLFGTGLHQSTQGCVVALEKIITPQSRVLDLGCGTGVLGIISLLLGAESAVFNDIETTAIEIVEKNASLNGLKQVDVRVGNILNNPDFGETLIGAKPYTVVVANIVADVIIGLLPFVKKALQGTFICAGIIDSREIDVVSALKAQGFTIQNIDYKDNWVCIQSTYEQGDGA